MEASEAEQCHLQVGNPGDPSAQLKCGEQHGSSVTPLRTSHSATKKSKTLQRSTMPLTAPSTTLTHQDSVTESVGNDNGRRSDEASLSESGGD